MSEALQFAVPTVLFYGLALVSVVLALAVVTTRRILRAAIYLMGVLLMSAGLYLLLRMEFLAGVQVLVYVGGIVVLLVFAVMLTSPVDLLEPVASRPRKLLAFVSAAGFLVLTITTLRMTQFALAEDPTRPPSDTVALGKSFLDYGPRGYALPFELISLLLLAAVIGGIVIARKTPASPPAAKD